MGGGGGCLIIIYYNIIRGGVVMTALTCMNMITWVGLIDRGELVI